MNEQTPEFQPASFTRWTKLQLQELTARTPEEQQMIQDLIDHYSQATTTDTDKQAKSEIHIGNPPALTVNEDKKGGDSSNEQVQKNLDYLEVHENYRPIRFELPGQFHQKDEQKHYLSIDRNTDLSQLQQVAKDYEKGESYCTYNMRFADYARLVRWIESTGTNHQVSYRDISKEDFQAICHQFETGPQVVIFPEGDRTNFEHSVLLTRDSSREEIESAMHRCSPQNDAVFPAALLPREKADLLTSFKIHKDRTEPDSPRLEERAYKQVEKLHNMIDLTDWSYESTSDPFQQQRGREQVERTRNSIKNVVRDHPEAATRYLSLLEAKQWSLANAIKELKQAIPSHPLRSIEQRLELPFVPREQPGLRTADKPLEEEELTYVKVSRADGHFEILTASSRTEDLLTYRHKAKSGQIRLEQKHLVALDSWIELKRKSSDRNNPDKTREKKKNTIKRDPQSLY